MISERIERLVVRAFALSVVALCAAWALLLPAGHQYDEPQHADLAAYIAAHGSIPAVGDPALVPTTCESPRGPCQGTYASLPPASPLLQAALLKIARTLTGRPFSQLLFAARLVGVLSIGGFVLALHMVLREVLVSPAARLTAVIVSGLIPQVTYIGAYVNDDAFALFAGTLFLYRSLLVLRDGLGLRSAIVTGILAGVVALTRLGYLVDFMAFGICIAASIAMSPSTTTRLVRWLAVAIVAAAVVAGWFFVRNIVLYGDAGGLATIYADFRRIAPDYSLGTLAGQGHGFGYLLTDTPFLIRLFISFWASFNWVGAPYRLMPPAVYGGILVLCVLASAIAALRALHAWKRVPQRVPAVAAWLALAVPLVASIALTAWNAVYNGFQPQGRYLFPGLPFAAAVIGLGLAGSARSRCATAVPAASGLVMLTMNIYCLLLVT